MGPQNNEPVIDDGNYKDFINPVVNDQRIISGLVPRDYDQYPVGCYKSAVAAVEMPLIPESEWSARIKEMEETKSRISDIRLRGNGGAPIPALYQNGQGFCWAYSTTACVMMLRAIWNMPYIPLSAHAVACKVMNFQDKGGWAALSLDYITQHGVPSQEFWAQGSMSRANDTPACWENAALNKPTEGWVDLAPNPWDRKLSFAQLMTLSLCRVPFAGDVMSMGHSMCFIDPVEVERGSYGFRILNSYSDTWGDRGMGILRGQQARPEGAVAPRALVASIK